jgi:hypothetical protein
MPLSLPHHLLALLCGPQVRGGNRLRDVDGGAEQVLASAAAHTVRQQPRVSQTLFDGKSMSGQT